VAERRYKDVANTQQQQHAWESFNETGVILPGVRAEIAASWRRSAGLSTTLKALPNVAAEPSGVGARELLAAVELVVTELAADLDGTRTAIVAMDASGVVIAAGGAGDTRKMMTALNLEPQATTNEGDVGTTVMVLTAAGMAAEVRGYEHHQEMFHGMTGTSAPIRHPLTGEIIGALGLASEAKYDYPLALPTVVRGARDIQRTLSEQGSGRERRLLERHLAGLRTPGRAMLTVDRAGRMLIQNGRMLTGVGHHDVLALVAFAGVALRGSESVAAELPLAIGTTTVVADLVRSDGDVIGAVVSMALPGVTGELSIVRPLAVPETLEAVEREAIVSALARNGGNISKAAAELQISRSTLHRRLRSYQQAPGRGLRQG
jgi:transcriptional regulator of acetoin/glycerol metabolism